LYQEKSGNPAPEPFLLRPFWSLCSKQKLNATYTAT
jgi:hypothetical protein